MVVRSNLEFFESLNQTIVQFGCNAPPWHKSPHLLKGRNRLRIVRIAPQAYHPAVKPLRLCAIPSDIAFPTTLPFPAPKPYCLAAFATNGWETLRIGRKALYSKGSQRSIEKKA